MAAIGGVPSALWPLQLLNPAWQWRKRQQRAKRRGGSSDEDYIRQLRGEERDS